MDTRVVIIGAGPAGLRVAHGLLKAGIRSVILEASPSPGGMTRKLKRTRLLASHRIFRDMCLDAGVDLEPDGRLVERSEEALNGTVWDSYLNDMRNLLSADYKDCESNAGSSHSARIVPVVHIDNDPVLTIRSCDHIFRSVSDACNIFYDTRVSDVRRVRSGYMIQCRCKQHDDTFVNRVYTAVVMFVCIPPLQMERWTITSMWGRAHASAIVSQPIHAVYARVGVGLHTTFHRPTGLVGEIQVDENDDVSRVSLTTGRLARFWQRLKMSSPVKYAMLIREELYKHIGIVEHIETSHFEQGRHMWRGGFGFDPGRSCASAIRLHATQLPNILCAGDAWSQNQGWIEGALKSADEAVGAFIHKKHSLPIRTRKTNETTIEGRIIPIDAFAKAHPGGEALLRTYAGRDATDAFYHARHSPAAWTIVYNLQVAFDTG